MFEDDVDPPQASDFVDPTAHMAQMKKIAMQRLPMSPNTQMHRYYFMGNGAIPEPFRPGRARHYFTPPEDVLLQKSQSSAAGPETRIRTGRPNPAKPSKLEEAGLSALKSSISAPDLFRSNPPRSEVSARSGGTSAHHAMREAQQFGKKNGGILTLFAALNTKDGKSLYRDSYRQTIRNETALRKTQRDHMLNTTDVTSMTDAFVLQKNLMRK